MEKIVYLLQHSYETKDGAEHTKTLGIFSSRESAEKAISEYRVLPGFKEMPDNFFIDGYELDKREWTEGFGVPHP